MRLKCDTMYDALTEDTNEIHDPIAEEDME